MKSARLCYSHVSKVPFPLSTTTSPFQPERPAGPTQDSSVSKSDWKAREPTTTWICLRSPKKKGLWFKHIHQKLGSPCSGFPNKHQPSSTKSRTKIFRNGSLSSHQGPSPSARRHLALLWDLQELSRRPRRTRHRPGFQVQLAAGSFGPLVETGQMSGKGDRKPGKRRKTLENLIGKTPHLPEARLSQMFSGFILGRISTCYNQVGTSAIASCLQHGIVGDAELFDVLLHKLLRPWSEMTAGRWSLVLH